MKTKKTKSKLQKRKTRLTLLAVTGFIAIAFSISLFQQHRTKSSPAPQTYILRKASSGIKSSEAPASVSSSKKVKMPNHSQLVAQFIQDYFTQNLDKKSLVARQTALQREMSDAVFQSAGVSDTTRQLENMLQAAQNNKAVESNSSVRLVNRKVQGVSIYQNLVQPSQYYVETTYQETAFESSTAFPFEKRLKVTLENGKITALQELLTTSGGGH